MTGGIIRTRVRLLIWEVIILLSSCEILSRCQEVSDSDEELISLDDEIKDALIEFKKSLNKEQIIACNKIDDLYVKMSDCIAVKMFIRGLNES